MRCSVTEISEQTEGQLQERKCTLGLRVRFCAVSMINPQLKIVARSDLVCSQATFFLLRRQKINGPIGGIMGYLLSPSL